MVLESDYPSDMRVIKEATALIEAGFEVFLLSCKGKYEKDIETVDGIQVVRVDIPFFKHKKTWAGILNVLAVINNFTHYKWKKAIRDFIEKYDIDILHVHDLPLVQTTLKAAKKFNKPVVADFHENYPAGLKTWSSWRKSRVIKTKNKLFFNYERWLKHEKDVAHKVNHIIAVVEEMKERLIEQHGLNANQITVISNTETKSFLAQKEKDDTLLSDFKDKTKIVYFGYFGPHRGLDTAIKALPAIIEKQHNIRIIVIGTGAGNSKEHLENIIKEKNLKDHVHFLGYQPFKYLLSYLQQADITIVPHRKNEHTDNTIPHKLFQFMMAKQTVLVSDCNPLKRVITETNGGWVFKAGDENDFADKVFDIIDNPTLANQRKNNAFKATANGSYNWETTSKDLVNLYKSIT